MKPLREGVLFHVGSMRIYSHERTRAHRSGNQGLILEDRLDLRGVDSVVLLVDKGSCTKNLVLPVVVVDTSQQLSLRHIVLGTHSGYVHHLKCTPRTRAGSEVTYRRDKYPTVYQTNAA